MFSLSSTLPRSFCQQVLQLAHDQMGGHLGHRKCMAIIKRRFSWPLLVKDIQEFCSSRVTCQQFSKAALRKAPMCECSDLLEPFECGIRHRRSFLKARGECKYMLTYGRMSSQWVEAVPLRSFMARCTARAMLSIFTRTSIP